MSKTITGKEIGNVSVSSDAVASISLQSGNKDYEVSMELAAQKLEYFNTSLESIGFEKKAVKTINFDVFTAYESVRNNDGNYKARF